jgi:hypothetical protein
MAVRVKAGQQLDCPPSHPAPIMLFYVEKPAMYGRASLQVQYLYDSWCTRILVHCWRARGGGGQWVGFKRSLELATLTMRSAFYSMIYSYIMHGVHMSSVHVCRCRAVYRYVCTHTTFVHTSYMYCIHEVYTIEWVGKSGKIGEKKGEARSWWEGKLSWKFKKAPIYSGQDK